MSAGDHEHRGNVTSLGIGEGISELFARARPNDEMGTERWWSLLGGSQAFAEKIKGKISSVDHCLDRKSRAPEQRLHLFRTDQMAGPRRVRSRHRKGDISVTLFITS